MAGPLRCGSARTVSAGGNGLLQLPLHLQRGHLSAGQLQVRSCSTTKVLISSDHLLYNYVSFVLYSKGRATYRSDNLSTVVILRDVISRIVTMNQLKVHISCEPNQESVAHTLALIWPRLEQQSRLVRKLQLAKALKVSIDGDNWLNSKFKFVYYIGT